MRPDVIMLQVTATEDGHTIVLDQIWSDVRWLAIVQSVYPHSRSERADGIMNLDLKLSSVTADQGIGQDQVSKTNVRPTIYN